ncbi:MAG: hypothetical protein KGJ59_13850 [Bacteroidota bacterium]|nr:hypothetical protein [Bacteroidota bacterium]
MAKISKQTSDTPQKSKPEKYVKYHNDGSIWAKGTMLNGQPHGYFEWFRKDGTRMRSGYFEKGKQAGEWTTYGKQGKVFKATQMKKEKI